MSALEDFVRESNRIEGIMRIAPEEVAALEGFLLQPVPLIAHMQTLVSIFQPGAVLRERRGLNVRVGDHIAPAGGPNIRDALADILYNVARGELDPWRNHLDYETLHPFTDGNGRSGRALWLWQMQKIGGAPLGFLHTFYYQTLSRSRP